MHNAVPTELDIQEQLSHLPCVLHGSHDSIDKDVIYYASKPSSSIELIALFDNTSPSIEYKHNQRQLYTFCAKTREENRNVILIDDQHGHVIACYKGTPDAINNQILFTFHLHEQSVPKCPITQFAERDIVLKVNRSMRHLLGTVGQFLHEINSDMYRSELRSVLRSLNFESRINFLRKVDFVSLFSVDGVDFSKWAVKSLIKSLIFQFVQTVAQFEYIEIYSKQTAVKYEPRCEEFVYRKECYSGFSLFNEYRDKIIEKCENVSTISITKTQLLFHVNRVATDSLNGFVRQCNGHIVDMAKERCVLFALDNKFASIGGLVSAVLDYREKTSFVKEEDTVFYSELAHFYLTEKYDELVGVYLEEGYPQFIQLSTFQKKALKGCSLEGCDLVNYMYVFHVEDGNVLKPLFRRNQYLYHVEILLSDIQSMPLSKLHSFQGSMSFLYRHRLFQM